MRRLFSLVLLGLAALSGAQAVHSVTDISHEFSFFFDGRFARRYLPGAHDARNWGTVSKLDLRNVNLLVLPQGSAPSPWTRRDVDHVKRFAQGGGGVLILGDHALFPGEKEYKLNALAGAFGATFTTEVAKAPLVPTQRLGAEKVETRGGKVLALKNPRQWEVLVRDTEGRPQMAIRSFGRGRVLVSSASLFGNHPDVDDSINAVWLRPLLLGLAANKRVDASRPPDHVQPENVKVVRGLSVRFSDYLAPHANVIAEEYFRVLPAIRAVVGVEPSPGMLLDLILLPTGGGGFSSGKTIGLGVYWGGFPKERYGMVELIGHEATHSWVLPFPEPMWNEGLATYVGIEVARRLGHRREAEAALARYLRSAEAGDPGFKTGDLAGKVEHRVSMGKPMWIFEQLKKDGGPDIVARYFQAKRRLVDPTKMDRYTADDSVAVLSAAAGRDLFPWFRSLGINVDRSRTNIK